MSSPRSALALLIKIVIAFLFTTAISYFLTGSIEPSNWSTLGRVYITIIYVCCTLYTIFTHKDTNY
jgi:hypothetical protein